MTDPANCTCGGRVHRTQQTYVVLVHALDAEAHAQVGRPFLVVDLVDALAAEYADKSPREILELALSQQGEIAISFSGAEDVVLIDIASRLGKPFRVFSLDARSFACGNLSIY